MRDFSRRPLLSFILMSSRLRRILRKPITALLKQNGKLKALKPHQESSAAVVQSSQLAE